MTNRDQTAIRMSREKLEPIPLGAALVVGLTMLDTVIANFATSLEVMHLSFGPTFFRLIFGVAAAIILGCVTYKVLER